MVAYGRLMRRRPTTSTRADTGARSADAGTPRVVSRAPTRIDFGGGWTDVPPYPERDGGFVCNLAIARYARVQLGPGADAAGDRLTEAALRRAGVAHAARIENDFPLGAGLGGSSAAGVALQAAIAHAVGEAVDREALVRRSRAVEVEELGIAGGWQDHYAAAYGGALALDFASETTVHRIPMAQEAVRRLERRCLLVYTGESRISGGNISAVLHAYAHRERRVLTALARMAMLARDMAEALRDGDVDALGALVREHWVHQRSLHPAITTDRIDALAERATKAGAIGIKALGASGGGCVVILTGEDHAPVRDAVATLGECMDYVVDTDGVHTDAST